MRKLLFILLLCLITSPAFGQFFAPNQKPMLGLQVNWAHPLSKDLVGYWLFNEDSGGQVFDLSGNGLTGTFVGSPSWVPSKFGYGINFPATNDYISGGNISLSIPYTIVAHVKTNTPANAQSILSLGTDAESRPFFGINASKFIAWTESGTYRYGNTVLSANTDYHIAFVIPANAGSTYNLYLNGVLDNGTPAGSSPNSVVGWRIGMVLTSVYDWNGVIDYVMIWNRALTASEIALLYQNPFVMVEPSWNWILYGGISVPTGAGQVISIIMN